MAVAVLALFVVIPPASAWLQAGVYLLPAYTETQSPVATSEQKTPAPLRQCKHGWPLKGLLRLHTAADEAPVIEGFSRPDERQQLWKFLLHAKPVVAHRLDYCAEFTKPDSVCMRSLGTPKSHRSPPADIL